MSTERNDGIWDADAYTRLSAPQTSWGERVLARIALRGDETVLDAGCGTGKLTKELLARLPRGRVVAVDRDPSMVEATRRALAPAYGARLEVREADLAALVLDEPVDLVFSTATLHWVLDHDRLFAALFRALRPGGRLVAQLGGPGNLARIRDRLAKHVKKPELAPYFAGWTGPWLFPEEADTQRRLERAGFVDVATHVHAAPTPFADEAAYRDFLAHHPRRAPPAHPGSRAPHPARRRAGRPCAPRRSRVRPRLRAPRRRRASPVAVPTGCLGGRAPSRSPRVKLDHPAALVAIAALAGACAAPAPRPSPAPVASAPATTPRAVPSSPAVVSSPPVAAEPAAAASTAAPPPTAAEPTGTFPPPSFAAPVERTAKPGDGTWTPIAGTEDARGPALYRTTIHPDRIKGWVEVTLVAIDRSRVDLRLVAGSVEPLSRDVPADHRPGLVPEADRAGLLAVFNGGFMARHGGFGMRVGADRFLPPREDACTIALASDGGVRIAPWKAVAPDEPSLAAWRQTPECLVTDGRASEDLAKFPKRFGGAENGDHEIRRSALGLDASGRTLFYAHGEWTTAEALGAALAAAGVTSAAELDINWSYTRFLLYRHAKDGAPEVSDALVPKTEYGKRRYIEKPADRDFFYLVRRVR